MSRICRPDARSRCSAGCFLKRPVASCSVRRSRQTWNPALVPSSRLEVWVCRLILVSTVRDGFARGKYPDVGVHGDGGDSDPTSVSQSEVYV